MRTAGATFDARYEALSTHADLIVYNGHAGLGANVNETWYALATTFYVSPEMEYFYFRDDFKGGIDTGAKFGHRIDSIQAWVTSTDATDTFKGVDRSRDPRMSGVKLTTTDVATLGVEEVFEQLFDIGRERANWSGGKEMFVSNARFRQLSRHLESRRMRMDSGKVAKKTEKKGGDERYSSSGATFSYNTICLEHQSGSYEIIDEVDMPNDYVLATSTDDWEFVHWDGFPHLIDDDGTDMLRLSTEDDYEMRWTCNASFKPKKDAQIIDTGRAPFPVVIAPHGLMELTAIFVGGGVGLRIGWS